MEFKPGDIAIVKGEWHHRTSGRVDRQPLGVLRWRKQKEKAISGPNWKVSSGASQRKKCPRSPHRLSIASGDTGESTRK